MQAELVRKLGIPAKVIPERTANPLVALLRQAEALQQRLPLRPPHDDEQEQAARTLGASSWQTFRRITLPAIRWAVIYGVILTTARCLGEFGAVAVVSGHIQGETETATLRVEERYQSLDLAGAYAISIVLAVLAVLVLVAMTVIRPKEEAV
jgi:sulfate transport system permease protein